MRRVLLVLSIGFGVAYALFPGNPLLKGGPVGSLALLALLERDRRDSALLAVALAFGATGDVFLDLDPRFFLFGLVAFLCGHLTYVTLYVRNRAKDVPVSATRKGAVAVLVIYSAALSTWIVPSVGPLAVPVVFYVGAITAMVASAILGRFEKHWVAWGAVGFLISDSILAINKFRMPVPAHDYLIWVTYYLGQMGMALGFLESVRRKARIPAAQSAISV